MSKNHNISDFAAGFIGGGIRPHLFKVQGEIGRNPGGPMIQKAEGFHIKAASLPASTLGIIEVPYRGRKIKVPGDRTFAEWSVTVICTGDFRLRDRFEEWSNDINEHVQNTSHDHVSWSNIHNSGVGKTEPHVYKPWSVTQMNRDGKGIKEYEFVGIWPSEIGQIEMDYETTDSVAEFPVTLQYSYWTTHGRYFKHSDHQQVSGDFGGGGGVG
jgi:hypothetical protein